MAFRYLPRAKIDDSLLLIIIQGHSGNWKQFPSQCHPAPRSGMDACVSRKWYEVKKDLQVGIVVFQAGHRNHLHDAPSSIYPSNGHNNDGFTKLGSPIRNFFDWRCSGEMREEGGVGEEPKSARDWNLGSVSSGRRERWTSGILGVGEESGWMDG